MKLPNLFESLGNSSDDIDNFKDSNMSSVDLVNSVSDEVNVSENANKISENGDIKSPEKCLLSNGQLETDKENSGFHMSVMKSVVKKLLDSVPEHNSNEIQNSLPNEKKNWDEPNTEMVHEGNSYLEGVQDEVSSDEESLHLHLTEDEDSVNSSPKKDASSPASTVNEIESNNINDCTKDEVEDGKALGKTPETEETDCFPSGNFEEHHDHLGHTTSKDEIRLSLPNCRTVCQSSTDTQSTKTEIGVCESKLSSMVSETSLDSRDESYLESNELSPSIEKEKELDKSSSVESCVDKKNSQVLNILPGPNSSLLVNSDESAGADLPVESCDIVLRMDSELEINKSSSEASADVKEDENLGDGEVELSATEVQNSSSSEANSCRGLKAEDKSDHLLQTLCNSNESDNNISIPENSPPKIDSEILENRDKVSNLLTPNNLLSNVDVKLKDVLINSCSNLDKLQDKADLKNVDNSDSCKTFDDSKNLEKCDANEKIKHTEYLGDLSPAITSDSSSVCEPNSSGVYNTQKLTKKENVGSKETDKLSMKDAGASPGIEQGEARDSEMKEDVKLNNQLFDVINSKIVMDEAEMKCSHQKSAVTTKEISSLDTGDDKVNNIEAKLNDKSSASKDCNSGDNLNVESRLMDTGESGLKLSDETNIITEPNTADNLPIESTKFQEEKKQAELTEPNTADNFPIESTKFQEEKIQAESTEPNTADNFPIESTKFQEEKKQAESNLSMDQDNIASLDSKKDSSSGSVDHCEKKMEINLIDGEKNSSTENSNEKYGTKEVPNHPDSDLIQSEKPSVESNLPKSTSNEDKSCSVSSSLDVDDVCLSHRLNSNESQDDSLKLTKTGQQDISCKKMESTLFVKSVEDLNSSAISVNIFEEKKSVGENISDLGKCGVQIDMKQSSVQDTESKMKLEVNKISETGNQQCTTNTPEERNDDRTAGLKSNVCDNQNECESKLSSCDSRNSFTSSDLEMEASDCSSVPSQKAVSQGSVVDMDQDIAESAEQSDAELGKQTRKRSHSEEDKDPVVKRTRQLVEVQTKEGDAKRVNRIKRTSSDTALETVGPKKMCTDSTKSPEVVSDDNVPETGVNAMPFIQFLRTNELKNLTRSELEEFVVQKVCEALTERSYVGVLRQQLQVQEQLVDVWQKKVQSLQKQVKDMDLVVKRFYNDQRVRKDRSVFPIKITRSVGLQVHMPTPRSHLPAEQEAIAAQISKRKSLTSSQSAVLKSPTVGTSTSGGSTRGAGAQYQRSVSAGTPVTNLANSPQVIRTGNVTSPAKVGSSLKTISPRLPQVVSNSQSAANNTTVVNSSKYSIPIKPARTQTLYTVPNNAQPVPIQPKPPGQVIDLTDEEDRVRTAGLVRNIIPSTSQNTSTVNAVATVGNQGTIRVVPQPQLTSSAAGNALLTPATAVGSTGRVTYLVPNSNTSLQQRQVLLSSTSSQQIVASNAASVTNAGKSQMQALLLKNGSVVSMAPLVCPTTTQPILRTSVHTPQQQQTTSTQISTQRVTPVRTTTVSQVSSRLPSYSKHPAQLPPCPVYNQGNANWKKMPPPPELKLAKQNNKQQGIVLSWNMTITSEHEAIASYQLYAYQEGSTPPSTSHWKKVGDVKALPLPMACTLTQFVEGHKYHFAVRAVDIHSRVGPFSEPESIVLTRK